MKKISRRKSLPAIHSKDLILRNLNEERELDLTISGDTAFTSTSFEYVKKKIRKLGVDDIITPVKGYFQDTLPTIDIDGSVSLLSTVI